ncbi:MAG: hypothetical protein ACRYFK_06615 [Janthinobacterium lividum]
MRLQRLLFLLLAWTALGRTVAWAQCTTVSTIDYTSTGPATGTRQGTGPAGTTGSANTYTDAATASSTSVTYSNYQKTGTGTTNLFEVNTNAQLGGKSLVWQLNYDANVTTANAQAKVTLTLNRLVTNLALTFQDIDLGASWQDDLTFDGYTTVDANGVPTGSPITLSASNFTTGTAVAYVSGNTAHGISGSAAGAADGNLTVNFLTQRVRALVITYKNASAAQQSRLQTLGINSISWCKNPVANDVSTAAMPNTAGQVNISPLSATADISIASYTVTTLPTAAQGVLYYNSTGTTYAAVTTTTVLTPAQAATLRFDPAAGASGNATFPYTAKDNAGLVSNTATYTLPITDSTCSTASASLDFSTRPASEDWKAHAALAVPTGSGLTTVSTGGYASNDAGSTFSTASLNNVQTLDWSTDYANTTNNSSSITFTFKRPVSNFALRVQDIDKIESSTILNTVVTTTAFIDQVTFLGDNSGTTVTPVLGPVNANTNTVVISGNTATGTVNNTSTTDASVIAYFPAPITSLTITYKNVSTYATNPSANDIGIDLLSFCRLPPVAANVTNSSRPSGQGAAPINALSAAFDGTPNPTAAYTITGLDASQGTFYVNNVVLNATNFPGLKLTAAQASQLSFAPAASFSGTAGFSYTATDDQGVGSNVATYAVPVTASGASGTPAACANPGKNGNATNLSGVVNTYFAGTASVAASASATTIPVAASVGSGTGIAVGDLLLVIQMQGADLNTTNNNNYGANDGSGSGNLANANFTAGTYEYVVATTALAANTAGSVGVASLTNSYATAAATTTSSRKSYQVVRIPQYLNVTLGGQLDALAWNGSAGGILALDVAGTLTLNGQTLNAAGLGFRGGAGFKYAGATGLVSTDYRTLSSQTANGTKGEGTAGTPRYTLLSLTGTTLRADNTTTNPTAFAAGVTNGYPLGDNGKGAPGNAGGGGTDGGPTTNGFNTGGGGGANGGAGGLGGWPRINGTVDMTNQAVGGSAFSVVSSARLVLGGGGGAGSSNDGDGDTDKTGIYSSGAPGGGLILVRTGSVSGTGTANASGDGNYLLDATGTGTNDGAGGGGAGGTVLITATTPAGLAGLTVLANGGKGASNKDAADVAHGPGGGGGGGVILANGALNSASAAVGGAAGTVTSSDTYKGGAYGAAIGAAGVVNAGISTSIANSAAGANCVADVATIITAATNPVAAGQTATLNVAFTNNGPLGAANVTRQVQLPAGLTNVVIKDNANTVIAGAAYNATTGLVTYPSVASLAGDGNTSASSVITFTAPASGPVAATSTIGTATPEAVTTNNTSTFSLDVTLVADVTTTLSGPVALNAGQPSGTFTATYSNYGPSVASTVTQQVTIPAGATNVLVNGAAYMPTNNVIDFGTAATLASGATNTFTYSFTAPTTTGAVPQTSNVATATSEGTGTGTYANAASFSSTIGTITDVSTTIAAASASVATGQLGTFNVTFANAGPSPATSPALQVQLPTGLSGVTITNTSAGTTGSYNATTGIVTYTYGTAGTALPSGTNIASSINFTVPTTGSVTAAAAISTATNELGRTANNAGAATITATPGADVATFISGPASTVAGTMTTYSVLTTNNGPSPATTVAQTVTLPTGLTNVFISNGGTYNSTSGLVTFPSLGTLVSGSVVNNTISFVAPSSSSITATANVSTATTDAVTTNNTSPATTTVTTPAADNPAANVYTTITTPSGNVAPGSAVAFTVVVGNAGPNTATAVVERVSLPTGLTGVTITDSNGNTVSGASYSTTTGVVTFSSVALLASGSAATYVVTVTAPASGLLAATASVAATTNDLVAADNMATTDVTVNAPSDVATALTGPTEVGAGQAVTYTVTTTNAGLVPVANVVQIVTIPAGLASVTLSGAGTYDAATGIVTFPTIVSQAAGNSVVNTISYAAPAAARLVSVAAVSADSPDNVRTNNHSAVTTLVDPISDVTVAISGPTTIVQGNQVDYAVVTTNNGPSNAVNVATRVQLPPGLGTAAVTLSAGGSYNNTTGVVTFSAIASQAPGSAGTITNIIRFLTPSNLSQVNATATVSEDATAEESNYLNNTASIITTETAPTTIQTDLQTTINAVPDPAVAGQLITLTVKSTNASTSTGTATGVVQRVALEAGLTIESITNGGTYDPITGVVTFPATSLTMGTAQNNTIKVYAPGATPLQIRALITGNQSDPSSANNADYLSLTVTQRADIATTVSGPTAVTTGDAVTYSVLTINNGPSPAAAVAQTVTIPTGLTGVTVTGGGSYNSGTGVVTFPTIASEIAGSAGQVLNTISFTAPSPTYTVVGNVSTTTTEPVAPGTANNTSTVTVAPGNLAPVANAVVNALQTPEGNTAGPLLISPLSATDANGNNTIASYRLTSVPDATTQGVLSLNGTALAINSVVLIADAANLRFDPVAGFVGNAFFGYTATDNPSAVSAAPALYTIPVGLDVNSTYTPYNQTKGNGNPYVTGDVLAAAIDSNGARYTSTGAIYAANGTLLNGAVNGLGSASLASGTLPSGVSLDAATGRIYVSNASALPPTTTATTYTVTVQTIDVNGGTNSVPVTFTLGANPLPVELVAFTAQAVQNRDGLLQWTTASEISNDHFDVERSLDGSRFVTLGRLAGQGSKASRTDYSFTDAGIGPKAAAGQPVYYRLKQVDATGTSSYSPVRSVSFTGASQAALGLTLYPNPAAAATSLDLSALPTTGTYQVLLLDATGRQVRQLTLGGGLVQQLMLSDLATGTYQVLVSGQRADGSVLRQVLRLIKE